MVSDAQNKASFDSTANNPSTWWQRAVDLHTASRVLRDRAVEAMNRPDWQNLDLSDPGTKECLESCGIVFQAAMLQAFAVECLLKCLWICKGNTVSTDGRYELPAINKENHDLPLIADALGFSLSRDERKTLQVLSLFGRSLGRYPISRKWQEQALKTNKQGVAVGPSWDNDDHDRTETVI